jgi:hypothetical protein
MKKTKTLLAFSLITALLFSPLAGMDAHGAHVVVTKNDGALARGELIAVKWDALVVSVDESSPLENTSIAIKDIENVEVIRESNIWKGMLWGALIGGGIGAVVGLNMGDAPPRVSFFQCRIKGPSRRACSWRSRINHWRSRRSSCRYGQNFSIREFI